MLQVHYAPCTAPASSENQMQCSAKARAAAALCARAGGDVKGGGVEPYAYWPLDRKMLNRRQQKSRGAKKGLQKIIAAAQEGAAKGRKAKRQRT